MPISISHKFPFQQNTIPIQINFSSQLPDPPRQPDTHRLSSETNTEKKNPKKNKTFYPFSSFSSNEIPKCPPYGRKNWVNKQCAPARCGTRVFPLPQSQQQKIVAGLISVTFKPKDPQRQPKFRGVEERKNRCEGHKQLIIYTRRGQDQLFPNQKEGGVGSWRITIFFLFSLCVVYLFKSTTTTTTIMGWQGYSRSRERTCTCVMQLGTSPLLFQHTWSETWLRFPLRAPRNHSRKRCEWSQKVEIFSAFIKLLLLQASSLCIRCVSVCFTA